MGAVASVSGEILKILNPSMVAGGGALVGGTSTVFVSEWLANKPEKTKARLTDEEQEQEEERKKAEKARIEALRVTHDDIKIRRKAHDQWRHEPKGPTKYELKEREERMLREHEEAMKRKEITTTVSTETRRKKGKLFDDEDTNRGRHRGAPKIKPPSPPNPNPFGDRFDQANELRGKIIPAPTIRDKMPKTGMSRGETGRDTADEVNDLLKALQTEPERDDHHEKRKQLFTGDSWSGRLRDDDGYKADELKRRSKVMEESANLDWLCAELEVPQKGTIKNKAPREKGKSEREKAREYQSKIAASKLPDDLLPY